MSQSRCWPTGEWGWILGQLANGSKGSWSWCLPAGGWDRGLGVPGAGVGLQVDSAGASASSLVRRTAFPCLWLQDPKGPRAGVLLVGGAGSWTSWLRVPRCPRAGFGLLLGRARAQRVL